LINTKVRVTPRLRRLMRVLPSALYVAPPLLSWKVRRVALLRQGLEELADGQLAALLEFLAGDHRDRRRRGQVLAPDAGPRDDHLLGHGVPLRRARRHRGFGGRLLIRRGRRWCLLGLRGRETGRQEKDGSDLNRRPPGFHVVSPRVTAMAAALLGDRTLLLLTGTSQMGPRVLTFRIDD